MSRRSRNSFSRRVFVHRLTFMGGGVILLGSACKDEKKPSSNPPPNPPQGEKPTEAAATPTTAHLTFDNNEYALVTAIVGRILPKDEDPGGVEAGVPEYIDHMLQAQQLQRMKTDFLGGLAALDRRCQRMYQKGYTEASPAQQDDVLEIFKSSEPKSGEYKWYEILLALTLEGFLGDPSYGGNKNKIGWKLVGFDMVGTVAPEVAPDYEGQKHLDHLRCGTKKGC